MRRLPRMRIGLRNFFALVTLFCFWIAALTAVPRYQRGIEAGIEARIRSIGGHVQHSRIPFLGSTLFSALGTGHIYDRIDAVDLKGATPDVELCRQLSRLAQLEFVGLNSSNVDRECLAALSDATALKGIDLSQTGVCDADLQVLSNLKALRRLNTTGSSVTREGVIELEEALQSDGLVEQWTVKSPAS